MMVGVPRKQGLQDTVWSLESPGKAPEACLPLELITRVTGPSSLLLLNYHFSAERF